MFNVCKDIPFFEMTPSILDQRNSKEKQSVVILKNQDTNMIGSRGAVEGAWGGAARVSF